MDMDLKDKLDYIGIVSNRILNYVNNARGSRFYVKKPNNNYR